MNEQTGGKILRGFSVLLSSQAITWILTLGYTILVPRYLGPEGMGRLSLAYAVTYILSIALELGMIKYISREIARDHSKAGPLLSMMLAWRIGLGVLVLGAMVVAVVLVDSSSTTRQVFYFAGLTMLGQLTAGGFDTLFRALEQFKYAALQDITIKAAIVFAAGAVVLSRGDVAWIAASTAIAWFIGVGQSLYWARRFVRLDFRLRFKSVVGLAWKSMPFWGTSVLVVIYLYLNTLMLSWLAGDTEVGWYSPPMRLFQTAAFLPVALGAASFPSLARYYLTDQNALVSLVNRNLRWILTASLPIATLCAALSPNFIPLLYGEKYRGAIPVMALLGATIIFTYLNTLTDQFLVATNRQLEWTKVMGVATFLNPFLNYFLITFFDKTFSNGAAGAATAFLLTESLMVIPAFVLLPKGSLNWRLYKQVGRTSLACIPMAGATLALINFPVFIPGIAGLAAFILSMWLLRALPTDEIGEFRSLLAERSKRKAQAKAVAATKEDKEDLVVTSEHVQTGVK